ncbi:hypothetical protein FDECE_10614 [Fusarium decemcellulare]|nr:hypothetical protein FDECE_10614 [Fusarium decemcellulare]
MSHSTPNEGEASRRTARHWDQLRPKQQTAKKKKVNPPPQLAASSDEFHQFVETLASHGHVLDGEMPITGPSPTPPAEQGPYVHRSVPGPVTREVLDTLAQELYHFFGSPPSVDDLPDDILARVVKHDSKYMDIVKELFKKATSTVPSRAEDSPFSSSMLSWLQSNAETQNEISEFLLHPHVRSFRCRAALGQPNLRLALEQVPAFELSRCGNAVPNVVGTYALHGRRTDEDGARQDLLYIGQAADLEPSDGALGIRLRSKQHWSTIEERAGVYQMYAHQELARVGGAKVAVLSAFPFPRATMGKVRNQYLYLLALAETVDIILLDCLDPEIDPQPQISLAPLSLHPKACVALNTAWPTNRFPPPEYDMHIPDIVKWSLDEVSALVTLIGDNEKTVFPSLREPPVQWEFLRSQLAFDGVRKTVPEIAAMYLLLAQNVESGFLTCRTSGWKHFWAHICHVKEHLKKKGLVRDPSDVNDIFYRIPELEREQPGPISRLRGLLEQTGFKKASVPAIEDLMDLFLPWLLHQDVWNSVKDTPPEALVYGPQPMSQYLTERTRAVAIHHALHDPVNQGVHAGPVPATLSMPLMTWSRLTQVWHKTTDRMLADGVPAGRILPGGIVQLAVLWSGWRSNLGRISSRTTLPSWTYEPRRDGTPEPEASTTHDSEVSQFERLASTNEALAIMGSYAIKKPRSISEPGPYELPLFQLGRYRPSSLRVLISIMTDSHRGTFKISDDTTDEDFWSALYIGGLDKAWNTGKKKKPLQQRFGWVLELIRTGCLPPEARTAREILREALGATTWLQEHPYAFVGPASTDHLVNPDLSEGWVQDYLKAKGALPSVRSGIARIPDMGVSGFSNMYGILMVQLWEDSWRPLSLNSLKERLVTRSTSSSAESQTRPSNDEPELENDESQPQPQPQPDNDNDKPATRSTSSRASRSRRSKNTEPQPKTNKPVTRSMSSKNAKPQPDTDKDKGKPATRSTSSKASRSRPSKNAGPDTDKDKGKPARTKADLWTEKEHETFRGLLQARGTTDGINQMLAQYPERWTKKALQNYMHTHDLAPSRVWTPQQDNYIKRLLDDRVPLKDCVERIKEDFGITRTQEAVKNRWEILGCQYTPVAGDRWTPEEINVLKECISLGLGEDKTEDKFRKKFGDARSSRSIAHARKRLESNQDLE